MKTVTTQCSLYEDFLVPESVVSSGEDALQSYIESNPPVKSERFNWVIHEITDSL